ncbi:hypothetical protein LIER_35525 [Lithospermum erythrorhizon]|uniref:Proton pump-interactor 1 n=1 Tax=Lithospermum erythrorhizon TaxID=34254 RepID=A0AAV3NS08_LITER
MGTKNSQDSAQGELKQANVAEEWPAPSQIHSFYVVKYRSYDDDKLKSQLEHADKDLQKIYRARTLLVEQLRPLRAERQELMSQIIPLNAERRQFRAVIDDMRKKMEPLQKNLGQLRNTMGGGGRARGSGLCSTEEELNAYIKSLEYRIQHESITLNEEKQILREIKQLESTREKVIANSAARAKIEESVGDKDTIQEQVKLIGVDLDGVRKEQDVVMAKLKKLDIVKGAIDERIELLDKELKGLDEKKKNANESLNDLKNKLRHVNAPFYVNADLLKKFRDHAAQKNIETLKQHTEAEVEKFVSQWASRKDFREDYERRILLSLDMRQLSRDGRMRNPDEKPLVQHNTVVPSEAIIKQPKENSVPAQKKDAVPAQKNDAVPAQKKDVVPAQKKDAASTEKVPKDKGSKVQKEANNRKKDGPLEQSDHTVGKDADADFEILHKDPPKVVEVDKEKLKEMKRKEEITKNRQALERKKKLAEKAAAKAAIKAQKEAEEHEKKARRRVGIAGTTAKLQNESNETERVEQEVAEEKENSKEKIEEATPSQEKVRKENVVRKRTRARGSAPLPKVMVKRKKATNYWPYLAVAVAVLLLLIVGYNYFV